MTRKLKIAVALPCLMLAMQLASTSVAQRYPVPVGAEHPDFRLPNIEDGKPLSLSDYRGKKVVLLHFASW